MRHAPVDRKLQLQIIFAFMTIYALLLQVSRPDATTGQLIFRSAIAIVGIVGFVVVSRR